MNGFYAISIYDPTNGTTVQLNSIDKKTKFSHQIEKAEDINGDPYFVRDEFKFDILCYDFSAIAQLRSWMSNKTSIRLMALGVNGIIDWNVDSKLVVEFEKDGNLGSFSQIKISLSKIGTSLAINEIQNLLYNKLGWADASVNNIADNYIITGDTPTLIFELGYQQIKNDNATSKNYTMQSSSFVVFPFAGIPVMLNVNPKSYWGSQFSVAILAYNFAGSLLGTYSGFNALTTKLPASTYKVKVNLINNISFPTTELIQLYEPYLGAPRPDTRLKY